MKVQINTQNFFILEQYLEGKGHFVSRHTEHRWDIKTGRDENDHVLVLKRRSCLEFTGLNKTASDFYADEFVRFAKRFFGADIPILD